MNDEELQKIQNKIIDDLNKEKDIEKNIIDKSQQIANLLSVNKIAKAKIDNTNYTLKYQIINSYKQIKTKKIPVKIIMLIVANDLKFKIIKDKYIPFFCKAEMDEKISLKENLRAVVEAFIRHKTGKIKPEILEE